jgi:hypothetical protein
MHPAARAMILCRSSGAAIGVVMAFKRRFAGAREHPARRPTRSNMLGPEPVALLNSPTSQYRRDISSVDDLRCTIDAVVGAAYLGC